MSWFQPADDIIVEDYFKEKFLRVVNIPLREEDQYKNDSTFSTDLNTFLKSGIWPLRGRLSNKITYHNLQGQILGLVQEDKDLNTYLAAEYQKKYDGGRRRHKSRRRKTQRRKTHRRRQ